MSSTLFDYGSVAVALVVRASLLLALASLMACLLRKQPAAKRSLAWLLCMGGLLALPLLYALLPQFNLSVLPSAGGTTAASLPGAGQTGGSAQSSQLNWSAMALGFYLLGVGILLLRFVAAREALARLWRRSQPVRDPALLSLLEMLCSELRLSRKVQLKVTHDRIVPMTWGSLAPKLLLPPEASSWSLDWQRQVLIHELAHVARFDSFGRTISSIACALYWFHPWAWLAARQLRLEQELAADHLVLAAGEPAATYACGLVELAHELGGEARHPVAAMMGATWQLERRIVAMAVPASHNSGPGAFGLCAAALLAIMGSALIAPVRSSSEATAPTSSRAPGIASARVYAGTDAAPAIAAHLKPVSRIAAADPEDTRTDTQPARETMTSPAVSPQSPPPADVSEAAVQPQPSLQEPSTESYGPKLQAASIQQSPDYRWRLEEGPPQSPGDPRSDQNTSGGRSAATPTRDPRLRSASSYDGTSDKHEAPFRFALRIVPMPRGRANSPPLPPPNAASTMLSLLAGTRP